MDKNRFARFCIKGMESAYIPSEHVFPASRQLIDGQMVLVRDRDLEYRFTMNALMGLHKARAQGYEIFLDIESDYHDLASHIEEQSESTINIAATAWTGRCIGTEIPPRAVSLFHEQLDNAPRIRRLGAKALAWLIAACVTGGEEYYKNAFALVKLAAERYIHPGTSLVRQFTTGLRRNWSSFGPQSYMAYAFLLMARTTGSEWARDLGLRIARKLVQMQGPEGQWPWMYYVQSGRVSDYYPVYSVHQYAYAPFFLVEAIDQGYDEFREPLIKGFRWILGQNELGQSMIDSAHQVVWRRIIRQEKNSKLIKLFRSIAIIHGGLKSGTKEASALQIDRQCWGFEMALPLCVFSSRNDFIEILDDSCFS